MERPPSVEPDSTRRTSAPAASGSDRTQTLQGPRKEASADPTPATPGARGTPTWRESTDPPTHALPIDDPDRYSLVSEHARGGLGRVVRAVDTRLGRTVAVKELLKKSDLAEALFVREALITARLQHPGIVPVIEAGRWPSGEPYYVMKLVEGRSLKEMIGDRKALPERLALLPHVIAVAEAIGYAHSRDVIHRDVKPANVVVGEFGETVVVDWGLARDGGNADAAAEDARLTAGLIPSSGSAETVSGRVIGTPQYMSPEQARGEIVDARADVYSLGALLFEVLAGAAPYTGGDADTILQKVIDGPPPPLAAMQPGVPDDLLAIVGKAMERAPAARYATAKELAQDLQRFATGKLVTAQHYTSIELVRRWVRRNRGVVAALLASAAILVVVAIGMVSRIVEERNTARLEGKRAQVARTIAERHSNSLRALQAESSVRRDPTATIAWLKQYPIDADNADAVATLVDEALATGVAQHVLRQSDWVYDVAFSPDSRLLATGSKDGIVRVYDTATGAMRVLGEHKAGLMAVVFTPDGTSLITGGGDGAVLRWPTGGGGPTPIGTLTGPVMSLSIEGDVLAGRSEGDAFGAWQVATGAPLLRLDGDPTMTGVIAAGCKPDDLSTWMLGYPDGRVQQLIGGRPVGEPWKLERSPRLIVYAHDGARVAVYDGMVIHVIDVATGAIAELGKLSAPVRHLTWAPDDLQLAAGGDMHDLFVFAAQGAPAKPRVLSGHADAIYAVEFTRDGRRLLSASDDGTARVWDLRTGNAEVLRGHEDDVYRARFSPDETLVATASLDSTARLWRIGAGAGRVLGSDGDAIFGVQLTTSGDALTTSTPFQVRRWDLARGTFEVIVPRTDAVYKISRPAMSPAGDVAYGSDASGDIQVIRADGTVVALTGHVGRISGGGFSTDGATLMTAGQDGTVRRWDLAAGTGVVIATGAPVTEATTTPDGERILVVRDGEAALLDRDGATLARTKGRDLGWVPMMSRLGMSPDGSLVAFLGKGPITLWTWQTNTTVELENVGHNCTNLAFSPDGKTVAGAMADRTVRLWNVADGRLIRTLRGHVDLVMMTAFSPDGTLLASTSYDRTVRVWNLATSSSRVLRGHTASVEVVRWLDGGTRLLTGSRDGTLRLWSVPETRSPVADELRQRIEAATTAIVGPGERLATPVAP